MSDVKNKCVICGRKARSLCSPLGGMICSACCGSKRGDKINCAADCRHYPFSPAGGSISCVFTAAAHSFVPSSGLFLLSIKSMRLSLSSFNFLISLLNVTFMPSSAEAPLMWL